jgi:FkbM family methyltransferase
MSKLQVNYGIPSQLVNITEKVTGLADRNGVVNVPASDVTRAKLFGDPLYGILKSLYITNLDTNTVTEYNNTKQLMVNILTGEVIEDDSQVETDKVRSKLAELHSRLQIRHGSFTDEYPEQLMAARFLTGREKVLEIGGNIGRNSLVIASILQASGNTDMVTLECDPEIASQLTENRDLNGLKFHIEASALSKNKLIQRGWDTMESDTLRDGYKWVPTITLDKLYDKYGIQFDTLVLDCEGAFYYILRDMPEILDAVKLIIMENDYHNIDHKNAVDRVLGEAGFTSIYQEAGGWGPCQSKFFEVFRKN